MRRCACAEVLKSVSVQVSSPELRTLFVYRHHGDRDGRDDRDVNFPYCSRSSTLAEPDKVDHAVCAPTSSIPDMRRSSWFVVRCS